MRKLRKMYLLSKQFADWVNCACFVETYYSNLGY